MREGLMKVVISGATILAAASPALAAADGLPQLDPSLGVSGTVYDIVMPGHGMTLDPALPDSAVSWGGNVYVYQGIGPVLEAYMNLDTNRDGGTDRTMSCEGVVGSGRFALHCFDDDGLGNFELMLRGRAVTLPDGRLSLRKAAGRGYSDDYVYNFGFQANQQLP